MAILLGKMCQHLNGHKDLTNHNEIVKLDSSKNIYIPLMNMGSTTFDVHVKEGDKVYVGTKVATRNDNMIVPLFSSVSGTVVGFEQLMSANLKPVKHIVIENDGNYEVKSDLKTLDHKNASREELIEFMMNAGIVGCGGAGFPAYIKYKFAKNIHTLVINGVECEPYITADYKMMNQNLDLLFVGVSAMMKMAMAPKAIIAIKVGKKDLFNKLVEKAKEYENISIKEVPDVYPMGWERTLVYQLFKKRYDKLPSEVGVVVNNSSTAISFGNALQNGLPIVNKMVTVSGDGVRSCANVYVPVGTQVKELIAACGGYAAENILLIAGGPMMGKTVTKDEFVVTPYTNAITVLKDRKIDSVACLKCGECSNHCPSGLQPVRIAQAEKCADTDTLKILDVEKCIECGLCSYICPSKLDVTENVRRAKRRLALMKK